MVVLWTGGPLDICVFKGVKLSSWLSFSLCFAFAFIHVVVSTDESSCLEKISADLE